MPIFTGYVFFSEKVKRAQSTWNVRSQCFALAYPHIAPKRDAAKG
jgi:hypothetical protein